MFVGIEGVMVVAVTILQLIYIQKLTSHKRII